MRKIVATTIVVLFIFSMNLAVEYAMTEYLRKVILNDDGTWEYADESEQGFLTNLPTKVVTATLTLDEKLFRTAHIKVLNMTGKTIVSLTHRYLLFNEFGNEVYSIQETIEMNQQIEPSGVCSFSWPTYEKASTRIHAIPIKAEFSDGSTWAISSDEEWKLRMMIRSSYREWE